MYPVDLVKVAVAYKLIQVMKRWTQKILQTTGLNIACGYKPICWLFNEMTFNIWLTGHIRLCHNLW